ncbi:MULTISPECIES: aminopeptidase P family protein [Alphaproteobacteria]|uniref:Xaa-Pro aminopeptidase n=2 Tax=Alphaproteobacteria TaxID=28211 RepID=A0A512HMZ2_9HYPH|nr:MULTISPECIES: aminopeptidase P family protein [Alphaproteobacteria]GEO86817.1 Xaa-Pro aminopeptidase [Ciceribacter naphthalenivorans]GLR23397.1 Xaa-Pro aminopeptidase [Ciceribacter naphthalenivorans]GLT06253.1 Xaa-Pro aminopeptidase [Sphingomonas psychrolutea]
MFQSFDVTSSPQFGCERVGALRARFEALGIDGFLVTRADEYQGEYVPACAERLSWLTGFTGSAGQALITASKAMVFVDGRYVTQLAEQVDPAVFTAGDLVGEPPHKWISKHAYEGFRLGIDPWLHTSQDVLRLEKALAEHNGTLVVLPVNPLDTIWTDRPDEPLGQVVIQPIEYSGVLAKDKIARISADLSEKQVDAALITDPSSIAWIFNIRGCDVPHTPHPLARAIINADGSAELFLDKRKTDIEVESYLGQLCKQLDPRLLIAHLEKLAVEGRRILVDPELAPFALVELIRGHGGTVVPGDDPAKIARAVKNSVELNGSAVAHLQDGVAVVEFLSWLDDQHPGTVSEIDAAQALEAARMRVGERMQNPLKDISFDTISGAGEHGAVIHYRVTTTTDRLLNSGELFLIDSGAQYVNGTTDITRTLAIGAVSDEQKRFFTLVLKGMIAISTARFPKGTRGCDLDPLARIALWKAGADFAHGTGHGVGSFLSVHEGPQRISRLATQELLPGMILSNEPGYYRPGSFGIRIENLVYVRDLEPVEGGDMPMMRFETLTYVPIDRYLVVTDLLTREELRWLDNYHAKTRAELMPLLHDEKARAWLERATEPFSRSDGA